MTPPTALARAAYRTLEPFHVTSYFNPELASAYEDTGLDGHAWHAADRPEVPNLALWHSITVLREWRGDGHLAALIDSELDPTEAAVFHEAHRTAPEPGRRALGKRITQLTRQWSESEWGSAAERLATRGLLTISSEGETLTEDGAALDHHIEERTDVMASAVWRDVPDAEELITSVRPYVKAVIDAGFLPGTKKR